jgi:hypothetical protein
LWIRQEICGLVCQPAFLCGVSAAAADPGLMQLKMLPLLGRPRGDEHVLTGFDGLVPVLSGNGDVNLECWRCAFPICHGLRTVVEVSARTFRCPCCDALNRSPR